MWWVLGRLGKDEIAVKDGRSTRKRKQEELRSTASSEWSRRPHQRKRRPDRHMALAWTSECRCQESTATPPKNPLYNSNGGNSGGHQYMVTSGTSCTFVDDTKYFAEDRCLSVPWRSLVSDRDRTRLVATSGPERNRPPSPLRSHAPIPSNRFTSPLPHQGRFVASAQWHETCGTQR